MQAYRTIDCHRLLKIALTGDLGLMMAAIQFLELQVNILRERLEGPVRVTPNERRKLKAAKMVLGDHAEDFLLIVTPKTSRRWDRKPEPSKLRKKKSNRGRPLTPEAIEKLIVRMAEENRLNHWSKTRIYGELRKMGLGKQVSRTTVGNIMIAHGFDPQPNRGHGSWHDYIKTQGDTMWACDFFTKRIWSPLGMQDHYILFFEHIATRQVYIAGATPHPNKQWVTQQARNFLMHLQDKGMKLKYLIRDNDQKFKGGFNTVFTSTQVEITPSAIGVPEMNGYAESFVKTIKNECLNHFTAMNYDHLMYLLKEYVVGHYNVSRPHRGLGNRTIGLPEPAEHSANFSQLDVDCDTHCGGILKSYRWKQAA